MSNRADKAKLDKGAAKIREAEKQAAASKPINEKALAPTRDIKAVLRDRVEFLPRHLGMVVADDTTLAESLQICDWAIALGEHVQFLIGDAINFGRAKWGEKYWEAIKRTGRAYDTLRHYAETARKIAHSKRIAHLSYSLHVELCPMSDELRNAELERLSKLESHELPTARELREHVKQLVPSRRLKQASHQP